MKTKQKKETENNCWELNAGFVHLQFCAKPVCVLLKLYKVTERRREQVLMDRIKQMLKDRLCCTGKGHERHDRRLMRYVLLLFVNSPDRHDDEAI